ncbi:MAG: hypothetical protein HY691_15760 [Chloroflexi bacterium]|nr:hypothetical protein [Chloroflexota bacterium]
METDARSAFSASVGRDILAGLAGVAVAVGCLLIPLVHLVTGPLAPLIGGWFAGTRVRARVGDGLIIGATIGICLALLVGALGEALGFLLRQPTVQTAVPAIAGFVLLYGVLMGMLGAILGGHLERGEGARRTAGHRHEP